MNSDCGGDRHCLYGQCRDPCVTSAECGASYTGDLCEHGYCGMLYLESLYNNALDMNICDLFILW